MNEHSDIAENRSGRALLKRVAATITVCALLAWVIYRAWQDALLIDWTELEIRYGLFAVSMALYGLGFVWQGFAWVMMMRMLGYELPMRAGLKASAASQFGNYVPGKVFIVIFRAQIAGRHGIPPVPVAGTIALETVLRNMVATLLAGIGLYALGAGLSYLPAAALLIAAAVVFAHPRVFHGIADWVLHKLNRPPLPSRLNGLQIATLLGYYFVYWGLHCFAFYLMVRATFAVEWTALAPLAIALLGSQIASTLVVFAPVGLGAKEATIAGLLQLTGGVPSPFVVALLMRVWRTASELIQIAIVWLIPQPEPDTGNEADEGKAECIEVPEKAETPPAG